MRKLFTPLAFIISFLSPASPAFAQSTGSALCPSQFSSICGSLDTFKLLGAFIGFIFTLSVVIALLYLIWGGFKWLTSGGDKSAVGAAREHIIAAVVGLIVIFLSYFILNLVLNFFLGTNLNNISFPTLSGSSSSTITCNAPRTLCTAGGSSICCAAGKQCGVQTVGSKASPICK